MTDGITPSTPESVAAADAAILAGDVRIGETAEFTSCEHTVSIRVGSKITVGGLFTGQDRRWACGVFEVVSVDEIGSPQPMGHLFNWIGIKRAELERAMDKANRPPDAASLPDRIIVNGMAYVRAEPETIAATFCDLDDREMATFFDTVASVTETWGTRLRHWACVKEHLAAPAAKLLREWAEYFGGNPIDMVTTRHGIPELPYERLCEVVFALMQAAADKGRVMWAMSVPAIMNALLDESDDVLACHVTDVQSAVEAALSRHSQQL